MLDGNGRTALHKSAMMNDVEALDAARQATGIRKGGRSYCGWTKVLHHLKIMGNHYALVFAGESSFQGFFGAGFRPSTVWISKWKSATKACGFGSWLLGAYCPPFFWQHCSPVPSLREGQHTCLEVSPTETQSDPRTHPFCVRDFSEKRVVLGLHVRCYHLRTFCAVPLTTGFL